MVSTDLYTSPTGHSLYPELARFGEPEAFGQPLLFFGERESQLALRRLCILSGEERGEESRHGGS